MRNVNGKSHAGNAQSNVREIKMFIRYIITIPTSDSLSGLCTQIANQLHNIRFADHFPLARSFVFLNAEIREAVTIYYIIDIRNCRTPQNTL